jgi:hypothetical protein
MITKINTLEEELNCQIRVIVRSDRWGFQNEFWGIQIDNTITPIFCCHCNKQLPDFYKLNGGRYGQVGSVMCNCGAEIHCSDSDNIVEYLETVTKIENRDVGTFRVDFIEQYQLDNNSFLKIKDCLGFDIFTMYCNQTIDLKNIISTIRNSVELREIKVKEHSNAKFEKLPQIINEWLSILDFAEKLSRQ